MKYIILFVTIFTNSISHGMEISYTLIDLDNNKIIKEKNQEAPMVLASVSKIYTSYYVLSKIDPFKTIKTEIYQSSDSKIKDGVLNGDLILMPHGNPFLTAQNILDLIYQIKNKGIKSITGKFIIDENHFWATDKLSNLGLEDQADNPAMGPFNVEFNRFSVDRKTMQSVPDMDYLNIKKGPINSPGLKFKFNSQNNSKEIWTKNTNEAHRYREDIPTRNSSIFSGQYMRYLANLHGLKLPVPEQGKSKTKGKLIAQNKGLPIYRLIELCIEYSNNLIAEMLLQQVSPSSPLLASQEMLKWYKSEFKGNEYNWKKTKFENGSGLTLNNKTTSKNLALVLSKIYNAQKLDRSFISYLSINGHSGGVRKRLNSPELSFKVFAKTGSLFYVNNLAGYLRANSGKLYAFSIFTTDSKKRSILNKENSKDVNIIRRKNKTWYSTSTIKIDSLIKSFIENY